MIGVICLILAGAGIVYCCQGIALILWAIKEIVRQMIWPD